MSLEENLLEPMTAKIFAKLVETMIQESIRSNQRESSGRLIGEEEIRKLGGESSLPQV
jgi:predicted amino acid dehydrogenase